MKIPSWPKLRKPGEVVPRHVPVYRQTKADRIFYAEVIAKINRRGLTDSDCDLLRRMDLRFSRGQHYTPNMRRLVQGIFTKAGGLG
jgi:hypothetical protein